MTPAEELTYRLSGGGLLRPQRLIASPISRRSPDPMSKRSPKRPVWCRPNSRDPSGAQTSHSQSFPKFKPPDWPISSSHVRSPVPSNRVSSGERDSDSIDADFNSPSGYGF